MATLLYDPRQKRSVNLDHVDSIQLKDDENGIKILFEKVIVFDEKDFHLVIDRWEYKNIAERDSVYGSIIRDHGKRVG
jgi:hypothetical protein